MTAANTRARHVPTATSHIYKSQRANGKWVFEVRHPADAEGRRQYEVVGSSLAAAKARSHEVHAPNAPRTASTNLTFAEVVEDWRATREMRPSSKARLDGILDLWGA